MARAAWLVDRPKSQTPYVETHKLEDVLEELKRKGQKYLYWSDGEGEPVLYDVGTGQPVDQAKEKTIKVSEQRSEPGTKNKLRSMVKRVGGLFMDKEEKDTDENQTDGLCVCETCKAETEQGGADTCADMKCPECKEPMKSKPEEERKALADWAEELGDEGYKAFLAHVAETERLTEEEAGLLAPEELADLAAGWLETEEGEKVGRRLRQKWVDDLTAWWKEVEDKIADFKDKLGGFFTWAKYEDEQETLPDDWASVIGAGSKSGFKSFKGEDGKWRWIAWAASAFEDREQEFFKTKALERYVAEAYKRNDHGKLWLYHLPLDLGDGDFTALTGRILLKLGVWADHPYAQKAAVYYNREDVDDGASVGYKYRPKDREDRAYDWLWIFETSPVPAEKAAFPFSRFDSFGGKQMEVTEDQKAKLREVFGDDWKDVLSKVESASKQLEDMGVAYKALQDDSVLGALLGEMLAEEAIAEKAKAKPVQMLKLALGKIKDPAAKGLVQKVIEALEKGGGKEEEYEYPKPKKKAEDKEDEEEYGKPKKKADEEEEEEEKPKKKGKKEAEEEAPQIVIEGLAELVEAVKSLQSTVAQQGEELTGLKAMLDAGDEERAAEKIKKAPPVVAYKASIAGLLGDDEEEGDKGATPPVNPINEWAGHTPLGPRGG